MAGPRIAAGGTLILDGAAVAKLAAGDARVRAHVEIARTRRARVVVSAVTLTEVQRGAAAGRPLEEVLARIAVLPVLPEIARLAGRCATGSGVGARGDSTVDSIVVATALRLARPVVLLTADPDAMRRLFANLPALGDVQLPGSRPQPAEDATADGSAPYEEITLRAAASLDAAGGSVESVAAADSLSQRDMNQEEMPQSGTTESADFRATAGLAASERGDGRNRRAGRRRVSVAPA